MTLIFSSKKNGLPQHREKKKVALGQYFKQSLMPAESRACRVRQKEPKQMLEHLQNAPQYTAHPENGRSSLPLPVPSWTEDLD